MSVYVLLKKIVKEGLFCSLIFHCKKKTVYGVYVFLKKNQKDIRNYFDNTIDININYQGYENLGFH